jgi:endonuclease/exonuclease/phosphatase (EEP) superfamily protein YafD
VANGDNGTSGGRNTVFARRTAAISLAILLAAANACGRRDTPPDAETGAPGTPGAASSVEAAEPQSLAGSDAAVSSEFRVATYNINFANLDLRQTMAVIRRSEADFVALQETNAQSEAFFRRHLAQIYPHMDFRSDRGEYAAEGFGILSKSPLANLRFKSAKHGLFGTWIGETELGGHRLQIAVVHLDPVWFRKGDGLRAMLEGFQKTEAVHAREIGYVHDNLSANLPTLIVGDFNSMSTFAAPTFLCQNGFIDSFASVTEYPDNHPTWRWPTKHLELAARIDYIFHTGHLETIESTILDGGASDHRLVVSRLRWRRTDTRDVPPKRMEAPGKL